MEKVGSVRLAEALQSIGSSLTVGNAGVGGNTTRDGLRGWRRTCWRIGRGGGGELRHQRRGGDVWKKPPATEPRVPLAGIPGESADDRGEGEGGGAEWLSVTPNPLRWTSMLRDLYGRAPYDPARGDGFDAPLLDGYRAAMREVAAELGTPVVDAPAVWAAALAEKAGEGGGVPPRRDAPE